MHTPENLTFLTLYNNIPQGAKCILTGYLDILDKSDLSENDTTTIILKLYQYVIDLDLCPEDKLILLRSLTSSLCSRLSNV